MQKKTAVYRWIAGIVAALTMLALPLPASAATLYQQPVWFEWEQAVLDVLIVPPEHGQIFNGNGALGGEGPNELTPYENSYLRATEQSIKDWDRAVTTFGAPWLQTGLVTNVYVVGRDTIPESARDDPEIIVASDQNKGFILGVAVYTRGTGGQICVVDNSKLFLMSFTYEDMYNVNGQEYGHCLGLDHVSGTPSDPVIEHDVMYGTYSDSVSAAGTHKHCFSNLNVQGLELVYGPLFGQPGGPRVTMESTSYQRMSC